MPLNNGLYRNMTNQFAYQNLAVPVYIPNPSLGIDEAQIYQPYNLAYVRYAPRHPGVVLPDPVYLPIEQVGPDFTGNPVQLSNFPADFYVGEPL